MDRDRFEALLAAYGADAARWPESERLHALSYLAATPSAHVLRADARGLDEVLDAWRLGPAAAELAARVGSQARLAGMLRPRTLWLSGAGLAAACLVGVLVGADMGSRVRVAQPTGDPAVTAALDGASEFTPNIDADIG